MLACACSKRLGVEHDLLAQTRNITTVHCQTPFIPHSSLIKVVHMREPSACCIEEIVGGDKVFIFLETEDFLRRQAAMKPFSMQTFQRCVGSVQGISKKKHKRGCSIDPRY